LPCLACGFFFPLPLTVAVSPEAAEPIYMDKEMDGKGEAIIILSPVLCELAWIRWLTVRVVLLFFFFFFCSQFA